MAEILRFPKKLCRKDNNLYSSYIPVDFALSVEWLIYVTRKFLVSLRIAFHNFGKYRVSAIEF